MRYRSEDYDAVHGQIIDDLRDQYEDWKESYEIVAQGAHQKEICKSKMVQLVKRANKLR